MADGEEWRPAVGCDPGYEVSSIGRVRSLPGFHRNPKVLPQHLHSRRGYYSVHVRVEGKNRTRDVHRLMCLAFYGLPEAGSECARHLNDVRTDNRIENLAWGSVRDNMQDMLRNRGHHQTKKTHCPQGHEYNDKNTIIFDGRRFCRPCKTADQRKRRHRKYAQAKEGAA